MLLYTRIYFLIVLEARSSRSQVPADLIPEESFLPGFADSTFSPCPIHGRPLVPFLKCTLIHHKGPHLKLVTIQRLPFQIPVHWGAGASHINPPAHSRRLVQLELVRLIKSPLEVSSQSLPVSLFCTHLAKPQPRFPASLPQGWIKPQNHVLWTHFSSEAQSLGINVYFHSSTPLSPPVFPIFFSFSPNPNTPPFLILHILPLWRK